MKQEQLNEWVPAVQGLNLGNNNKAILQRRFAVGPKSERITVSAAMARSRVNQDLIIWLVGNEEIAATWHGTIEYFRSSKITGGKSSGLQGIMDTATGAYVITIDPDVMKKMDIRQIFAKPTHGVEVTSNIQRGNTTYVRKTELQVPEMEGKVKTWDDWVRAKQIELQKDALILKRKITDKLRIVGMSASPQDFFTRPSLDGVEKMARYFNFSNTLRRYWNVTTPKAKYELFLVLQNLYQTYKDMRG